MHHYRWLNKVVREGWMKFLPSFKVNDRCRRCNEEFTHIWLDGLNKKNYLMCMVCRDEWMTYNRRKITKMKASLDKASLDKEN